MSGAEVTAKRRSQCPACDFIYEVGHTPLAADVVCLNQADVQYAGACRDCDGAGACFGFDVSETRVYGIILNGPGTLFTLYRNEGGLDSQLDYYGEGQVVDQKTGQVTWSGGAFSEVFESLNVFVQGEARLTPK